MRRLGGRGYGQTTSVARTTTETVTGVVASCSSSLGPRAPHGCVGSLDTRFIDGYAVERCPSTPSYRRFLFAVRLQSQLIIIAGPGMLDRCTSKVNVCARRYSCRAMTSAYKNGGRNSGRLRESSLERSFPDSPIYVTRLNGLHEYAPDGCQRILLHRAVFSIVVVFDGC